MFYLKVNRRVFTMPEDATKVPRAAEDFYSNGAALISHFVVDVSIKRTVNSGSFSHHELLTACGFNNVLKT